MHPLQNGVSLGISVHCLAFFKFILKQSLTRNKDAIRCRERAKTRQTSRETVVGDGK